LRESFAFRNQGAAHPIKLPPMAAGPRRALSNRWDEVAVLRGVGEFLAQPVDENVVIVSSAVCAAIKTVGSTPDIAARQFCTVWLETAIGV
jgi:hypothetical protein